MLACSRRRMAACILSGHIQKLTIKQEVRLQWILRISQMRQQSIDEVHIHHSFILRLNLTSMLAIEESLHLFVGFAGDIDSTGFS